MHIYIHDCVFQVSTWGAMCALRSSRQYFHLWLCQVLVNLPGVYSAIAGSLSAIGQELLPHCVRDCWTDFIWTFLFAMPVGC